MSVTCDRSVVFSRYSGFLHKKTDRHDITEILLKVALNTINLNPNYYVTKKDIYYETEIVKRPKQPYIFLIRIGDQWLSNSRSRLGERRFSKFIIVFISSCLLYYCIYLVLFVVLLYLSRLVCCIIVFISSCFYCI